ncbi:hypothetical protein FPV67DRAFT_1405251, partial [Lyophyllum atratum]
GLFVICNAIVASVAVWNHSLGEAIGWRSQIDIYLIVLGCLGLAHIFTIIFVELAYRHSVMGRVWFECLWIGLFWLLYLAGASAVTSIAPAPMCQVQLPISIDDTCVSTRLLLAFTWIMTIILLSYFFLLVVASLVHLKHDSRIFHSYVHKFPWGEFRRSLPSAPASPSLPKFLKKMPSIVAPKPQRPVPTTIYTHRAGLGSEYEIESYATPVPDMDRPLPPFAPVPAIPTIHNSYDIPQLKESAELSFYPQYIQSTLIPEARRPAAVHAQTANATDSYVSTSLLQDSSPLGNWPRRNPPSLPAAQTRTKPPIPVPVAALAATVTRNDSFPPRPRPSGPRRRSDGDARVAVPDLANVPFR